MIVAALYAEPWPQLFTTINFVSKAKVLSNARNSIFLLSQQKHEQGSGRPGAGAARTASSNRNGAGDDEAEPTARTAPGVAL